MITQQPIKLNEQILVIWYLSWELDAFDDKKFNNVPLFAIIYTHKWKIKCHNCVRLYVIR